MGILVHISKKTGYIYEIDDLTLSLCVSRRRFAGYSVVSKRINEILLRNKTYRLIKCLIGNSRVKMRPLGIWHQEFTAEM